VIELDLMSMSSSSMSGYDIDVEDVEIKLRRDRFLVENYPHIVVGPVIDVSDSWEHDKRLHNYSDIFLKILNLNLREQCKTNLLHIFICCQITYCIFVSPN
jgi:hypothetical protein